MPSYLKHNAFQNFPSVLAPDRHPPTPSLAHARRLVARQGGSFMDALNMEKQRAAAMEALAQGVDPSKLAQPVASTFTLTRSAWACF